MGSLSELGTEEREHEVAGEVGEGKKFEGVVAAMEFKGARFGPVAAERLKHLAGELGEHSGVVFAIDQESSAAGTQAALHIGHGANGSPELAQFLDGYMVP